MSPTPTRITVYGSRLSPFVEKVCRALALKRLDFDLVGPKRPGDLRKWNPQTGKIPVVDLQGERLWDSTFILRRLEQRFPAPPLFAATPGDRAAQRLVEDWADESLYWMVMALRWSPRHAAASADQVASTIPAPSFLKPILRLVLTRQIGGAPKAQGFGRFPEEVLVRELGERLDDVLAILGDRDFLFGQGPNAADLAVWSQLTAGASGPTPEVSQELDRRPRLREWMKRVAQATGG